MTRPCYFCGNTGNRKPCAEGRDRCAQCLTRQAQLAPALFERLLAAVGLKPPTNEQIARDRLTVNVEHSKSGSIGAASVGCGTPPKEGT